MAAKSTIVLLILFGAVFSLFGQDSKYDRLYPFDNEKFKERLEKHNLFYTDTLRQQREANALSNKDKYSMRWFEVHEEDMAQMPNMPIKKDVHYTMRIKKYDLQHPYITSPKIDSLLNNRELLKPLRKPKE